MRKERIWNTKFWSELQVMEKSLFIVKNLTRMKRKCGRKTWESGIGSVKTNRYSLGQQKSGETWSARQKFGHQLPLINI